MARRLLIAALALMLLATPAAAQFSFFFGGMKNQLVQFLLDQVSVPGEFEIAIEEVTDDDGELLGLTGLTIADADGIWLSVGRASLSVGSFGLLGGGIEIDALVAEDIEYLRAPGASVAVKEAEEEDTEDEGGLFEWPRSPVGVLVKEMRLDRVTVAPGAVAEQGFRIDVLGNAEDRGDLQAAKLTVTRTDEIAALIDLDYARDFEAGTLNLTLTAEEAAQGLVAELAGLPATSASRLSLVATGPLTDWQVDLDLESEEVLTVAGQARIGLEAPVNVTAMLEASPGAALDPGIARLLAPNATLDIAVVEDEDSVIRVERGAVRSPVVTLDSAGFYNRDSGAVDLSLSLAANPEIVEEGDGFAFEALGFEGTIVGTPGDLSGQGDFRLVGLVSPSADVGDATLTATLEGTEEATTARLSGGITGLRVDRLGPDLLGRTQIAATLVASGEVTRLDLLTVAAEPLTLQAEGQADPAGFDFRYSLQSPDLAPLAAAYDTDAQGRIDIEGAFAGPADSPVLSGTAALADLAFEGERFGQVALTHEVRLTDSPNGTISLDADGSRYGAARVATDFALAGDVLALTEMTVAALDATISGALDVDLGTTLMTGEIALDVPSLERAEAATGLALSGRGGGTVALAPTTIEGAFGTSVSQQTAETDLAFEDFAGFDATVDRLGIAGTLNDLLGNPGGDLVLSLDRAAHPQGSLRRARVDVTAESLTRRGTLDLRLALDEIAAADAATAARVTGEARVEDIDRAPRATFALGAEDIASPAVEGGATVDRATVQGAMQDLTGDPQGTVTLDVRDIAAAGFAVESFAAESTLATLVSAPAVALTGTIGPVAGPDLSLEGVDLEADLADLAGNGRGTATITARRLSGAAAVREAVVSADMTGLIAPAGTVTLDATGIAAGGATIARADLDTRLTDVEGRTDVDARLSIPAVEAEGARIDGIALAAKVADALATPRLDVRLDVAEVAAEGLTITAPRLTAAGPLSALALGLDAAGEMGDQPLSATLRATANVEGEPSATVSTLTAALGEAEVALEQPLAIRTAGGTTRIDDLALSLPGGRLSGQAALPPGGLAGDLTLAMADLGELRRTVSEDIPVSRGTFDLTAAFDTRPGQARADITGTGRGIGFEEAVSDIGDLGLDLGTTWNGRVMQAEAALSGPFGDPIEVTAALPLRATDAIAPSLNQNGPLQASVDWVGRVGPLWALVPAPDHVLDGDLTIDLDIGGTVADPAIAGGLGMRDGQYQNLETGTILTDLTMDSALEGTDVIQLALRGNDGASGTLTVDVALDEEGLDARVQAANAVLVRRDDVTAAISTDITAVGPLSALALGGTTTIERAEIRLVNAIPPSVADLGEVRIKGAPVEEAEEGAGSSITLDLKVVAPDEVFVRGRGLQSEWQIDLAITGTAARPIVVGSVEKRRGTLDILGRFFNLDEGEVIFDGGREIDPRLNVVLSHENDGTTGFIRVSGTGSDPAVNFSSEPALPEDEVLPRVIFGRSSQSLSGIEALQLASAIATLLDGSGGFADQFRGAVGLDVLSVQTGDDGDTSVVVGRNVAEGVFVGAEQPIGGDGQSKVTVEIDVFENVIVDGELEGDGGTSLGVQWRKDF